MTGERGKSATAVEDYVKVIYSHTEWQPEAMMSSVLAARLGLAASSVTEMVAKLARLGLVTHVPYGAIGLTAEGESLALRMLRRHRLIETWLVREFGYRWDEVHDEAEVLEHAVSDRLLDEIDAKLGHPGRDPHGDPIPSATGIVVRATAVVLAEAPERVPLTVVRISDRDPALLQRLEAAGVTLDARLVVLGAARSGGPLRIGLGGSSAAFTLEAAAPASIWVSVDNA